MGSGNELRKGSTPVLVLAVLADGPRHGYAIAREIERRCADALKMGEGALYPALRALEREGTVVSRWEPQASGPARRIYTLTEGGRAKLVQQIETWRKFADAVGLVIGGSHAGSFQQ